jgi:hypothetical protein
LPVEEDFDWQPLGSHGRFTQTSNRRLVIVNKGKEVGTEEGFRICEKCGAAAPIGTLLEQKLGTKHKRPYLVDRKLTNSEYCQGQLHSVLLGTVFSSDLLLIRVSLNSPLGTNMRSSISRNVLEDGLRTLSEALLLVASRTLDIDPAELSAGFRIVPTPQDQTIEADIYLFDTLKGGAGYANQVGEQLKEILAETLQWLEKCSNPECTHSCQDCLRHYANQYWHEHLDRLLAADLLYYLLKGTLPKIKEVATQRKQLQGLQRLLELEGCECRQDDDTPLLVKCKRGWLAVATYPGLLDEQAEKFYHPLHGRHSMVSLLNDYFLERNLPGAYQKVKESMT